MKFLDKSKYNTACVCTVLNKDGLQRLYFYKCAKLGHVISQHASQIENLDALSVRRNWDSKLRVVRHLKGIETRDPGLEPSDPF